MEAYDNIVKIYQLIVNFNEANDTGSFNSKAKVTGQTNDNGE